MLKNLRKKTVILAGATGTVGLKVLSVLRQFPDEFELVAVSANKSWESLVPVVEEWDVKHIALTDSQAAKALAKQTGQEVQSGQSAVDSLGEIGADLFIACSSGSQGLKGLLSALGNCKKILLANKEPMVMAGNQLKALAKQKQTEFIPLDSEHNAVMQCLLRQDVEKLERVTLTASGGPFLRKSRKEIYHAPLKETIAHPNWKMGAKISVDSANMMNKGLEIIEAANLFDFPLTMLHVVIHPSSHVHAVVDFLDGSSLCHLGHHDMAIPISAALNWPKRLNTNSKRLELDQIASLEFETLDPAQFPALDMCKEAGKSQELSLAINAANEVAVAAYIQGKIPFGEIIPFVSRCLDQTNLQLADRVEEIILQDELLQKQYQSLILTHASHGT